MRKPQQVKRKTNNLKFDKTVCRVVAAPGKEKQQEQDLNPVFKVLNQNELVEQILKHLSAEDIMSCARVNQLWSTEAKKFSWKWSRVEFSGPNMKTELDIYRSKMNGNCHGSVAFGKINTEEDKMAVLKFATEYNSQIMNASLILSGSEDILSALNQVATLTLKLDENMRYINLPRNLIMSNVKKLILVGVQNEFGAVSWPINLMLRYSVALTFIKLFPSVQHLILGHQIHSPVLAKLKPSRESPGLKSLTALSLRGYDNASTEWRYIPEYIMKLSVHLTVLELDLNSIGPYCSPWNKEEMQNVLAKHGPTLKHLGLRYIGCFYSNSRQDVKIASMKNLVKLEISYCLYESKKYSAPQPVYRFDLIKPGGLNFPKLEHITIKCVSTKQQFGENFKFPKKTRWNWKWDEPLNLLNMFFPLTSKPHPNVKRLFVNDRFRKPSWLAMGFHKLLPNVVVISDF